MQRRQFVAFNIDLHQINRARAQHLAPIRLDPDQPYGFLLGERDTHMVQLPLAQARQPRPWRVGIDRRLALVIRYRAGHDCHATACAEPRAKPGDVHCSGLKHMHLKPGIQVNQPCRVLPDIAANIQRQLGFPGCKPSQNRDLSCKGMRSAAFTLHLPGQLFHHPRKSKNRVLHALSLPAKPGRPARARAAGDAAALS